MRSSVTVLAFFTAGLLAVGCRPGAPTLAAGGAAEPSLPDAAVATVDRTTVTDDAGAPDAADAAAAHVDAGSDAGPLPAADAAPDAPYAPPAVCPAALVVGAGTAQDFGPADAFGLSVTPDELTVAWATSDGGGVTIHYVDRATTTEAFGAARTLTGAIAAERVALTPDGLGLVWVDDDGLGFSIVRRDTRDGAFGAPAQGPFGALDSQGQSVLAPAGQRYADPLFAADGAYFVFSRYGSGDAPTVYLASRIFQADPYSTGTPLAAAELRPNDGHRLVVTGAAVDARTFFVWDAHAKTSRAVSLGPDGAVSGRVDLGRKGDLQPAADCAAFWFTAGTPAQIFRSP